MSYRAEPLLWISHSCPGRIARDDSPPEIAKIDRSNFFIVTVHPVWYVMGMVTTRMNPETIDELFVSLFERIDTAVFSLDGDGNFLYVSPAVERITGSGPDSLLKKPLSVILFEGNPRVFKELVNEKNQTPVVRDALIVHAESGTVKCTIACRARPGQGTSRFIGIIARKDAIDPEVEKKMALFALAVEQSPSTVMITDKSGAIQYVNKKFSQLTGYSLNDVLGHNPRILKSGMQSSEFYDELWQAISSGREWRGEFHNLKKNGEPYWEAASISPVMGKEGEVTHYVAVKEDVTARKKAEIELLASEENLRKKNNQIERDLRNAQMAVERLLPVAPPQSDRLRVDFRYLPMETIGGDYFSFNTLHEPGLGVFIGDVAGHGVSAALFLALVRSMSERLNARKGTMPSEYLDELNHILFETMSLPFFTALYGFFDFSADGVMFRFAKGGHTPPVLYRSGEKTALGLHSGGMPVGISMNVRFQEMSAKLAQGDRIYLYTDGITEARNANKDMLETEGLLDIVRRGGAMGLGESLDYILAEAGHFREGLPAEDDIVLIGFEVL